MTVHWVEPKKSATLAALTELVGRSATSPSPPQLSRGLNAVSSRLASARARRRSAWRVSLAAMAVTVCLGGVFGAISLVGAFRLQASPPALTYHTEGGTVLEGGYLRESGRDGLKVSFSEGTEFILTPGTHGRLRSVDSAGARIAIDHGTASFHVAPRNGARWLVDVGPFLITVKGTVFSVSWDVSSERFEVRLQRGRVAVSGPVSGGDILLRSGQRLVVDLPKAETLITEDKPAQVAKEEAAQGIVDSGPEGPAAAALPGERQPPTDPRRSTDKVEPAPKPTSSSGRVPAQSRWAEAVAAADWDRILREAEQEGVAATLETGSSVDLSALADAARYRRRAALARDALLAQRRRFPGSTRSLDAAYLLGRVEESSETGTLRALQWYDEYLARAPRGTYASEALGRKMILTSKLRGSHLARPLAEEYLERFPKGAYAGSAQALLRGR